MQTLDFMLYPNDQGKMFIIPNTTFCVFSWYFTWHVNYMLSQLLILRFCVFSWYSWHVDYMLIQYVVVILRGMGDNHVIIRVEGRVVCRLNIYFHVLLHMMFFRHNYSLHLCCGISIFILSRARLFISVLSKPDIHL